MIDIDELIKKFQSESLPIILVGKFQELKRHITVRFLGYIKESTIKKDIVLFKFKPFLPMFIFKNDNIIKAIFSLSPESSYETILKVKEIDTNCIYTSYPETSYLSREIRIEPSPKRPVLLYILSINDATVSAEVVNISAKGICFLSEREYKVGGQYGLTIILPENLGVITCYGEIKHKKADMIGFFRYGAELLIHPKDKAIITRYIMLREKEIMDMLKTFL